MATYSTDVQILAECPKAANLNGGASIFSTIRELIYARINAELYRRPQQIVPGDLLNSSQLTNCEVYGVLAELNFRSASKGGGVGTDPFTQEGKRYFDMYQHELGAPLSINGDTRSVSSIRLRRA